MNNFLVVVKRKFPDARIWHVRGRFRHFSVDQSTFTITSFYVIFHLREEIIIFTAKSPSNTITYAGIVLSRFTSLVESEYAKQVIPSPDWHLLVISLPKETNQRLLAFLSCHDEESCLNAIESGRTFRRRFLTGIKNLVSKLLRDDV